MSDSTRWVLLFVPDDEDRWNGFTEGVLYEAPKHPLLCVMLANERETGLFARKALPAGREDS